MMLMAGQWLANVWKWRDKMKLVEINNVFAVVDQENFSYMAPGVGHHWPEDQAPIFIRRLISSRGGKAAWWKRNNAADSLLNASPFCPVLRGRLRYFLWGGPYDSLPSPEDDGEVPVVRQGGTQTLNYYAAFWGPLADPVRSYLAGLELPEVPFAEQGHLEVYSIDEPPEEIRRKIRGWNYLQPQSLYNHSVCGLGTRLMWRVVDGVAIALIRADRDLVILSADHQDSPLTIHEGWYALKHPVPRPQRPVD